VHKSLSLASILDYTRKISHKSGSSTAQPCLWRHQGSKMGVITNNETLLTRDFYLKL